MSTNRSGFIALETIAIIVIAALVIVVTAAIVLMPRLQENEQADTVQPEAMRDEKKIESENLRLREKERIDIYATPSEGEYKSFSQRVFEDMANQNQSLTFVSGRHKGKIESIDYSDGLKINLISDLGNNKGRLLDFFYDESMLPRLTVSGGTIEDLKTGDNINIDETYDHSKDYPDSLIKIEISWY